MKLSTEALARASARHPWRTIVAWLLAMAAAITAVALLLGDGLTSDAYVTNDPDSLEAYALIAERFPTTREADELVVLRSDELTVDDPVFRDRLEALHRSLEALPGVDDVRSRVNARGPGHVSAGGDAALVRIWLGDDGEERIERVIEVVEDAGEGPIAAAITGEFTLDRDFGEISERDLRNGELRFGLPAALIVLVLVFGALVAAGLPLVLALVSIAVALGLTALVSVQWDLSIFVVNMLTGMGLALGIDYALFVVSRFREEGAAGREKIDAIAAAGATASRAVLFSGSAFVLAMLGLLLVQSNIMRSLAAGAILVGIVSVVAALTLLPALLSLLGDRVDRLRVPVLGRRAGAADDVENRFWGAIVRRVVRRPALSFALAASALVVVALPVLGLNIGAAGITTLPDDTLSKQGFVALAESFRTTSADPVQIVVQGDVSSREVRAAEARFSDALEREPQFGAPSVARSQEGDIALMTVPVIGDPIGEDAVAAVRQLRAETLPAAFEGVDARVLVTGTTAENIDYFDVMEFWLPIVLVFVLGLSFVLLTVAFRSIVVPATAIVLNLLSVGAAYGLVVSVFQHGIGNELLGFQQVDTIEAWVPLFLFAVLFGLSMDYQVFLLSRIRERYSETGDTAGAVAFGVGSTGRIITGAALIIVAVFAGFAAGDLVMFQQMGFGVAVALLVDATIVRSILVPSAMTLLGRWNWYLPTWLDWLPHIEVEAAHAEAPPTPTEQGLAPAPEAPAEKADGDLAGWHRAGGHRLQFYATDAEIAEWLREMLPPAFAPYTIVGQEWRDGRWQLFEYALDAIDECFARHRAANLWIRSDALTPGVTGEDEERLSLSGLVLVQLGTERNGALEDASIAIVDRIRHTATGREQRRPEYLRIFERLRRSMRKRLVVTTAYTFPDGSVRDHWRMTARAAEAHSRGEVTFAAKPVGLS